MKKNKNALQLSARDKEEIKWIKFQRNIAILGMIAAIFSNSLQYVSKFFEEYSKATLTITSNDLFFKNKLLIIITKTDSENKIIAKAYPKDLEKGISLKEGSYSIIVQFRGDDLFEEHIYIKKRDVVNFNVPNFFQGSFLVFAKINAHKVFPDMPIPLIIESTRAGYLWIYDLKSNSSPKLIFPKEQSCIEIREGDVFILPQRNLEFIKSGKEKGVEKLLFIVTEKLDKIFADKIAQKTNKNTISKANSSKDKIDYGLATITYKVGFN